MLSYSDCDNQKIEFTKDKEGVSLVRTDEMCYIPKSNLASYATPDEDIYEWARDLSDGAMRDSEY